MQTARIERIRLRSCPVRRIPARAISAQTSLQSRQVRMHWSMSIGSARQASAHELQIAEQSTACFTARPSVAL